MPDLSLILTLGFIVGVCGAALIIQFFEWEDTDVR